MPGLFGLSNQSCERRFLPRGARVFGFLSVFLAITILGVSFDRAARMRRTQSCPQPGPPRPIRHGFVIEFLAHRGVPFLSRPWMPIGPDHAQMPMLKGQKMKKLALTAAVIGLGLAVATPAEAAKRHRHNAGAGAYAMTPGGTGVV